MFVEDFTNSSDGEEVYQWNGHRAPKTPGKSVEHLIRLTGLNPVSDESDEVSSSEDADVPKPKKKSKHKHKHTYYPYGYHMTHTLHASHRNCKKHKSRSHKRKKSKSKKRKPKYPCSVNRNNKSPPRYSSAPTWERVFQPFNIQCVSPQIRAMQILQEMQATERDAMRQNARIKMETKMNQGYKHGYHQVLLPSSQSRYEYDNMYMKLTSESTVTSSKSNINFSLEPDEIKIEPKMNDEVNEVYYSEKCGNIPIRIKLERESTSSPPVKNSSSLEMPRLFEVKVENEGPDERKMLFGPRRGKFIRTGYFRPTKEVNKYIPLKEDIKEEEEEEEEDSSDEMCF